MTKFKGFWYSMIVFFNGSAKEKEMSCPVKSNPAQPLQDIAEYKIRRQEIAQYDEPIEGIFYIISDEIIPDYYSECLFSEVDSSPIAEANRLHPRKRVMYCFHFYRNYIRHAYKDIAFSPNEKSLPRGRVEKSFNESATIKIDKCYYSNESIIKQILKLYRLTGKVTVESTPFYLCTQCRSADSDYGHARYTINGGRSC